MQILANAMFLTTFYLSFAIGLSLIFGVMRVVNYAHGEIFMVGGYSLYLVTALMSGTVGGLPILGLALICALIAGGVLGALIFWGIITPLRDKPFSIFMATLALSYVLQVGVIEAFGPVGRSIPPLVPGIFREAGMVLPTQRLVVVGLTLVTIVGLWLFLSRSRLGRAIRATAQNNVGARLQGVSIHKIGLITIIIGSGLSAASGVLMGSIMNVNPFMGGEAIWRAFIVIIVGGIGSLPGAALAAALFGTLDSLLTAFGQGQYVALVDAVIMLAILSFLPNGLMGNRQ